MSLHERFSEQDLEILRGRAERAAETGHKEDANRTLTALQITLGSESYALPVELLRAVYENTTVVSVPCTPPFVAGIANIRGRITPVLDLAVLLNVPRGKSDGKFALVVVARDEKIIALKTDHVDEMMTFPMSSIGPVQAGSETLVQTAYIQGVLEAGSILLNVNAILDDPALIVADSTAPIRSTA